MSSATRNVERLHSETVMIIELKIASAQPNPTKLNSYIEDIELAVLLGKMQALLELGAAG